MGKQIALLGGTFDPVHFGHLITARAVAERCGFERITLVPTASPPHKEGPRASGVERLAMLQLAVADDPLFDICQLELNRSGPSYTLDTLLSLRQEHGVDAELCWIVGADMLEGLATWNRVEEVLDLARIVVALRPPWEAKLEGILGDLRAGLGDDRVTRIRESIVTTPLVEISSSDIRRRVAEGRLIKTLVPESVMSYINKHELYR